LTKEQQKSLDEYWKRLPWMKKCETSAKLHIESLLPPKLETKNKQTNTNYSQISLLDEKDLSKSKI